MQNKKLIPILIVIVLAVAVGAFAYMQATKAPAPAGNNEQEQQPAPTSTGTLSGTVNPPAPTSTPTSTGQAPAPSGPKQYTLAQVAAHATAASCWSVINGGVYDLTKWIPQHPGGQQAILGLCGHDGSAAFNQQHGGMQQQATVLATFKIGVLAK